MEFERYVLRESPSRTLRIRAFRTEKTIFASDDASTVSKSVFRAEPVEFCQQRLLVIAKAFIHVVSGIQVHARFPIVETRGKR